MTNVDITLERNCSNIDKCMKYFTQQSKELLNVV